ncbi:MAG: nicotinamide-nucleotide amidohydrolase family protein [Candidatus Omnitrophica bacterium]|nr:nicotinamide-nucleotide amidohydrolase family protein [Candidatus Omnitrophota bacterium]
MVMRAKTFTVSVAESCTGGLLAARITDVPGSSDYFRGGIIAYHDSVKRRLLGIDNRLLKKFGAVSGAVAKKMAAHVRALFETDCGIGITGIAGPSGGTRKKPVGLVYISLATAKKMICKKFQLSGNRMEIREKAVTEALNLLKSAKSN